jgi:hypothetical protein
MPSPPSGPNVAAGPGPQRQQWHSEVEKISYDEKTVHGIYLCQTIVHVTVASCDD